MLAESGLRISAGKMSGLWSGTPASIKLGDLDVICAVVGCGVEELLIPSPPRSAGRRSSMMSRPRPPRRPGLPLLPGAVTGARSRPPDGRADPGRHPAGSCPDCLSWGHSYGSQSYCRACYDFTRRYGRGECAGCRRVIAVKKDHCRLCWLQAGIAAAGRRRMTPEDFKPSGYWQLSLAGMSRLGGTGPARPAPPEDPAPPAAAPGWVQLQLSAPGESLHFDKRHWAASAITSPALEQARRIAASLAAARGWNDRIITETSRALAVVLAGCQPGDMIAWSQLPAALHRRDLSITRTAEILGLAGLLDDDRIPSFTSLAREMLALLPAPMAADVQDWLRVRSQGGPAAAPATSTPSG